MDLVQVGLPAWLFVPAAVGALFVVLPLAAMLTRVEWGNFFGLISSDSSRRGPEAQPAHLERQHGAVRAVRGADGHGPGPHQLPRPAARCAPSCCCRWCSHRWWAASRCSTRSAGAGCSGHTFEVLGIQVAFSTTAVVMAQTFVALPFLVVSLEGALRTAGGRYEAVASTLGARPTTVFRRVTLPLVLPGLVSGAVLSFARALGEFGATITFAGSLQGVTRTLPLEIYLQRETDADAAVALSLVLVIVAVVVIGFARGAGRHMTFELTGTVTRARLRPLAARGLR